MQAAKHSPASKLYGAAKDIKRSMKPGDLEDFTHRKPKGLPDHVQHEALPLTARELFQRQWALEGRDDLADHSKVNVEPETRSYARMTSKDVMDQPGGTARKWTKSLNLRKAITNQRGLKGFTNQDKGQTTSGGKLKESTPESVVNRLLA